MQTTGATKSKPIYKVVDEKGRVLIPKELRLSSGIEYGGIVRLETAGGKISLRNVELIEVGDESPEAVEAFVRTVFKVVPDETRLQFLSELTSLLQAKEGTLHQ